MVYIELVSFLLNCLQNITFDRIARRLYIIKRGKITRKVIRPRFAHYKMYFISKRCCDNYICMDSSNNASIFLNRYLEKLVRYIFYDNVQLLFRISYDILYCLIPEKQLHYIFHLAIDLNKVYNIRRIHLLIYSSLHQIRFVHLNKDYETFKSSFLDLSL